jgi:hypothetical protein
MFPSLCGSLPIFFVSFTHKTFGREGQFKLYIYTYLYNITFINQNRTNSCKGFTEVKGAGNVVFNCTRKLKHPKTWFNETELII